MIIQFKEAECIDTIREILYQFSSHTMEEIISYFPQYTPEYVRKAVLILLKKHDIQVVSFEGIDYYSISNNRSNRSTRCDDRSNIKPALDFVRSMISAVNQNGKRKNKITYMCKGAFPCTLYFDCNNTLYDVYYIPRDKIGTIIPLIQRIDNDDTKINSLPHSRIIIADSSDYFDEINVKNIKYKVHIEDDGTFTYEAGND